jgi:glycosyltransferase involved in cell wall biosynthesis
VHENLPATLREKRRVPRPLRRLVARVVTGMLTLADRWIPMTLAEDSYRTLFTRDHPVFPNFLAIGDVELTDPAQRSGVVYLGDVTEERGLLDAVAAVGRSAATRLTLIGRAGPEVREWIGALAWEEGVEVTFTGFLPPDEALPLVGRHAVALSLLHDVPNYRDSLPTKMLEYLAMGVPVVASDLPTSRAVLSDAVAVEWVPPGDRHAIAAAIDRLSSDPAMARAAVSQAPVIRERFRWPADRVRRFYAEV